MEMTPSEAMVWPERFHIDREIGRGGMAIVYRAHDRHLDRFVAIKLLSPDASHEVGTERFQREIAVMAKLVHPGIVALFDSGHVGDRLFYVMPLVSGETLRARLTRQRRLTLEETSAIGADVAEALAYAHGAGIVHRDVKPENIFSVGGRAILADFGIAHVVGQQATGDRGLTTAGVVMGTVSYMSPEQVAGTEAVDGRADLYSLGCVLYELMTGAPPFTAATSMGVLAKHLTEMPRPPVEHNADVTPAMNDAILQLLAKEPSRRPANAGDVARILRASHRAAGASPTNSEADRLVAEGLKAYQFATSRGGSSGPLLEQAAVYFRRALTLEPNHARALCAMGNWHYVMGNAGLLPRDEAFGKGREMILAALAADDQIAQVHCSMGKLALYYDDDCLAAARHVERAVALDAHDSEVLRFQSIVYKILGRAEDAVRAASAATVQSPDVPALWNSLGDVLLSTGRNAEAVDALKHAIGLQAAYSPALERLELARVRLGELDLALEIRSSRLRLGGQSGRADLLLADAESGGAAEALRRDARRELEGWLERAEGNDPFAEAFTTRTVADRIVTCYAELGEWDHAMDWLERAYERRPGRLRRMLTDLPFDHHGLAADRRYARLLRVAGLEELL